MTKRIDALVHWNEQAAFASPLHGALADPAIEQLPGSQNTMLSLGQAAQHLGRRSIPHSNSVPARTASDFLSARPEI